MTACAHTADVLQAADDRTPRRRAGFCSGLRDHLEQHSKFHIGAAGKFSFGKYIISLFCSSSVLKVQPIPAFCGPQTRIEGEGAVACGPETRRRRHEVKGRDWTEVVGARNGAAAASQRMSSLTLRHSAPGSLSRTKSALWAAQLLHRPETAQII